MKEEFVDIEENFPVEEVYYGSYQAWPILRNIYANESTKNIFFAKSKKITQFLKRVKTAFYGFKSFFRRYEVMVIAPSGLRRLYPDGLYHCKSFETIIQILGPERCLYVESPNAGHFSKKKIPTKNIVSRNFLNIILNFLFCVRFFVRKTFRNKKVFQDIQKKYNLSINDEKILKQFIIAKWFYKIFFRLYGVKHIFINYYCSYFAETSAAKELGITVTEVQHGVIGRFHSAYCHRKTFDKYAFPNFLLSFGSFDKTCLEKDFVNFYDRIEPVGSEYIDVMKKQPYRKDLFSEYHKKIVISCQEAVNPELAVFFKEVAKKDPSTLYLFSLRGHDRKFYEPYNFTENIKLIEDVSIYELIKISDIHVTCYSTTAFESLALGTPNILVDIKGLGKTFFEKCDFNKNIYSRLAFAPDEFLKIVDEYESKNFVKAEIIESSYCYFSNDYLKNIKCFLQKM